MFAHQVIEDLKNFIPNDLVDSSLIMEFKKTVLENLPNAQQFHIGDIPVHVTDGIFKIKEGKTIFHESWENYKLPFKNTWFDWIHSGSEQSKQGVLAIEENKKIYAFCFGFYDKLSMWLPTVNVYCISDQGISITWLLKKDTSDLLDAGILTKLEKVILLLGCKNIITKEIIPNIELNKARVRRGRLPLYSYKILEIEATTEKQKSLPKHLWENRIHLCRGHFKTYTVDKPLFGTLTGRYWWQAQARGNKKLGVVMKDYELKNVA